MQIGHDMSVALVVSRTWANLHGVKMFLRSHEESQPDIRGMDDSHTLFATVLDADDVRGIWIELTGAKQTPDFTAERYTLMVPWTHVLTIVMAEHFSASIRQEARKIGFTGETERE